MKAQLRKYLRETRRPIYSAALVLPFFLVYHAGTLILRTTYVNGADALIVRLLSAISVRSMFASGLVLLACFVVWQVRSGASWKIDRAKLTLLFVESLLFASVLFWGFGWLSVYLSRASAHPPWRGVQKWVLYCGAGVYEELLFRGFLLGGSVLALTRFAGMSKLRATVAAAVVASLLFSAFHYIGPDSDLFTFPGFLQRLFGGLYFSALFVTRGFGVAAASHALYDILVGLTSG